MDSTLLTALASFALLILAIEGVMWHIFHRKIIGMCLPEESGPGMRSLFTRIRFKAFAIIHTILLIVVIVITYFFLW
ncbi:MAG: hypothetical protein PHH13_03285 [Candidatus Peribacteraceae bacterium]|nr:hypothetical protein [Candidatus Peribacteraceae bacterium]